MNRLVPNPYVDHDFAGEAFVDQATLEIYRWIDENLVDREDDRNVLRCSAAPMCVRRRAIQARGIQGTRMAPRSVSNFMLGDLFEYVMKFLILKANVGPGKLYSEVKFGEKIGSIIIQHREFELNKQIESSFKVGSLKVTGHFDGVGRRNIDGRWEIIEAKSAGNSGFRKFKKSGPVDYIKQGHALMLTEFARQLGADSTRFFYGRKSSGHLASRLVRFDQKIAATVQSDYVATMAPKPPAPPYSLTREVVNGIFTGRLVALAFPCGFCPYINTEYCHNGLKAITRKDEDGHMRTIYVKDGRG